MNKHIGILTFHGADNHGCVLQCMGLQHALNNLAIDDTVEVVNYVLPGNRQPLKVFLKDKKTLLGRIIRVLKFKRFRKENLNISSKVGMDELKEKSYDIVLVGSDQVWNPYVIQGHEFVYFLKWTSDSTKRVSYAASVGFAEENSKWIEWLAEGVREFDRIAVRERSAEYIFKKSITESAILTLDPTMLHSKEWWEKFEKKPKGLGDEKYVFMYALGYAWNKEEELIASNMANSIAKKENLIVIHNYYGAYKKRFPETSKHCHFDGPAEFLWLVHHAEYVICCSFHGTVYSVIYEKPFYSVHTGGNGSRMQDLVEILGIPDRCVKEEIAEEQFDWNIDWASVKMLWNKEKEKSIEYLKSVLKDD